MCILVSSAILLMKEGKIRPFHGSLLQLGRQEIVLRLSDLRLLADFVGFQLFEPSGCEILDLNEKITDDYFFKSIGFSDVLSVEYGVSESADYVLDLNNEVEEYLFNKFDLIYDGGTCEHIFNIPVCFSNICKMLKTGGRIIHEAGSSGTIDHGFYSMQPTLFYDFYITQNFLINSCKVVVLNKDSRFNSLAEEINYVSGMFDYDKTWALSNENIYNTFFVASKEEYFEKIKTPQQSIWARF